MLLLIYAHTAYAHIYICSYIHVLIHTYAHVYREYLSTKGSLTEYIADSDRPLKFTNAHLDPFEPDRVWLTFYPKSTGNGYEGAPEVIGVSINVDGLCYKVTAGYITDRTKSAGGACLLYTSPSPRDCRLSRMPSSA